MTTKLTLDNAGRVMIPKALRDELNLEPGDSLDLESQGERIVLRPVRGTMPLRKEDGIWVFRTGQPLPATAQTPISMLALSGSPASRDAITGANPWTNWSGPTMIAMSMPACRYTLLVPMLPVPKLRRSSP